MEKFPFGKLEFGEYSEFRECCRTECRIEEVVLTVFMWLEEFAEPNNGDIFMTYQTTICEIIKRNRIFQGRNAIGTFHRSLSFDNGEEWEWYDHYLKRVDGKKFVGIFADNYLEYIYSTYPKERKKSFNNEHYIFLKGKVI
jgi:hypothetical protein